MRGARAADLAGPDRVAAAAASGQLLPRLVDARSRPGVGVVAGRGGARATAVRHPDGEPVRPDLSPAGHAKVVTARGARERPARYPLPALAGDRQLEALDQRAAVWTAPLGRTAAVEVEVRRGTAAIGDRDAARGALARGDPRHVENRRAR